MKKETESDKTRFLGVRRAYWNGPNIFAGAVCLVVFVCLTIHLIDQHRFVRSNDALVQAHFTSLASQVPGMVISVYVEEHDHVKKGQILARIDDRDYQTKLTQAAQARESTAVQTKVAYLDFKRAETLFQKHDLTAQAYDLAKTNFQTKLRQIEAAQAQYEQAAISQDYTNVRAPEDGIIALRSATAGREVRQGEALFGIVYPKEKWVEARIKETDLADIQVGETVQVKIDAIPGRSFRGKLESISPSTEGLEAAIIPDNSAGNFTKYVQRVPVKIALTLSEQDQELVRAGLSADVRLKRGI